MVLLHCTLAFLKEIQKCILCLMFCICILPQDFPEKAWEPKVQLPYKAEQGQVPRKIEIERFVVFAVHWKSCMIAKLLYDH